VTKFLRDALAVKAVGVPELDEKARAKGLLGERQSITTAKVFKRAKKSLGSDGRLRGKQGAAVSSSSSAKVSRCPDVRRDIARRAEGRTLTSGALSKMAR
jgi:hypothetical protein